MVKRDGKATPDVALTPGTGRVDFPKVLAVLRAGGFTGGHLVVECLASTAPGDQQAILAEATESAVSSSRGCSAGKNAKGSPAPPVLFARCEWGHDGYSLQIENLPKPPKKARGFLFEEMEETA